MYNKCNLVFKGRAAPLHFTSQEGLFHNWGDCSILKVKKVN